ncbi:hypothetical protein F8153_07615 [Alkaliphilus serpentinus]|uniref:Uncharacterized protein n=1 Tax=Alkaliphilus serpentinus TaxID=1482731 RepID=A0A833HP28_9FIRM|nr:hypothetical protein F8153_07615 [Alkaliphilus serpentinus]
MPSASGSHYQAHSGLSPPSYRPCWAHKQKASLLLGGFYKLTPASLHHSSLDYSTYRTYLPIGTSEFHL